jgi:hypothetical protein
MNELQENIDSLGSNFEERYFIRQVKYSVDSLAWVNDAIARIIKLVVAVHNQYSNNKISEIDCDREYISVSHLCCIFCSLFMDARAINFRGRSGQFEKWKPPEQVKEINSDFDLININQEILSEDTKFSNSTSLQGKRVFIRKISL